MSLSSKHMALAALLLLAAALAQLQQVEAGQGCPFDDGSCHDYCNQQGCNMGYCGHFAWIQCICRKCGDEWSWYDKVRYNPDKTVNQTELDSLKLNGTAPIILTNSKQQPNGSQQVAPDAKKAATLTTLLIPDLSDPSGKLDLNDIPDENSDKFLEYLAKNHEKLAQATSGQKQQAGDSDESADTESAEQEADGSTPNPTDESGDTIELQISTSNNNTSGEQQRTQAAGSRSPSSPVARLLKVAVMQRSSEEID